MKAKPIRLLVVDDHPVVRAGLRVISELDAGITIVGEAGDGAEAVSLAATTQPDVVLLDVRLRGESGIEVCRQLKDRWPQMRVLFLTSYADSQTILHAIEAGADGYLLKENDSRRLVEAIHEVVLGESVFDAQVTRQLANRKANGAAPGALNSLSPQERRLLAEIATGKTDKEAATALGLTPKTVRNYLERIYAKLGVHTRTEAAMIYARSGSLGQ